MKLKNNIFTSKSNALKFLEKNVKRSRIEKIFDFTVEQWVKNKPDILQTIKKSFNSRKVIVRSSARGEDSPQKSQAGNYESVQNVNSLSIVELKQAIKKVIDSYNAKGNFNPKNQILIQRQSSKIITSGVVFTREPNIGAPYYVINYDEGIITDRVTKGQVGNTIKIFKEISTAKIPKKWNKLIYSLKEIEKIIKTDLLDVEFGITETDVVIFQVRPLTGVKNKEITKINSRISKLISKNKEKFNLLKNKKRVIGNYTVFSDMCDWNPAEIIGNNPNLLDYSLYDYLIMNSVWYNGRTSIGYQKIKPTNLMIKFGNKPYTDVITSFNSLIPEIIPNRLKKKLIKFYLDKLSKNPYLHDKVEFEILFTCYDFCLDSRLKELETAGFSKQEICLLKKLLLNFTKDTINNFPQIMNESQKSITKMEKTKLEIISRSNISSKDHAALLTAAEDLIKNTKTMGALPFATMARLAFVATAILKSLEKSGEITSTVLDNFMNSISTPLSEIQHDVNSFLKKKLSKKDFLQKYGHLRPGTYDITAQRYDKQSQLFKNLGYYRGANKTRLTDKTISFEKIFKKHNIIFKNIQFDEYLRKSIILREKIKFEFTKGLSDALELIADAGKTLGFSREEIACLDLNTIFTHKNLSKNKLKKIFKRTIERNSKIKKNNDFLVLPSILFSEKDFEVIRYNIVKPNYITKKMIAAEVVNISSRDKQVPALQGKIVVIENADPGFDWIFSKNLAGLITKYGGVASHMAIRCAELNLPAAIGCGEQLYDKLVQSSKALLDCGNEQIIMLEHKIKDEFIEEKRVLKSLGYIK